MDKVTVNVSDLILALSANCVEHQEIFEKARVGYRKSAVGMFKKQLALAEEGFNFQHYVHLDPPKDHTDDYQNAIQMLEMTRDAGVKTIEITRKDFQCYVRDNWGWKEEWVSNSTRYLTD